jgi:hypothetical protein
MPFSYSFCVCQRRKYHTLLILIIYQDGLIDAYRVVSSDAKQRMNPMEKAKVNDHFTRFPYKKQVRDNGDINNGGIDLVKEPERIIEIHELNDWPWLKRFVQEINAPNGLFMTFE